MTSSKKDPVLVILQLSGGNDAINTIVPYNDPLYAENRPSVRVTEDQALPINDSLGFHPSMGPLKDLYDDGKVAIIQGVGYPNPNRSHFRSMDIWHTCQPDTVGTEGWVGRAIREMDPASDNVLTGVNFGRGLPRAMVAPQVPVASVGNLETYGVLTGIGDDQRGEALEIFSRMYSPAIGRGPVVDYLSQTGTEALKGADILSTAPEKIFLLGGIRQEHGGPVPKKHCPSSPGGFRDQGALYYGPIQQLRYPCRPDDDPRQTVGRYIQRRQGFLRRFKGAPGQRQRDTVAFHRISDAVYTTTGSGTDHGSGGIAFVVGEGVNGGLYGEYPSLAPEKLLEGDLQFNNDFSWLVLHPS